MAIIDFEDEPPTDEEYQWINRDVQPALKRGGEIFYVNHGGAIENG
jgi:hypothetical protein